ncbi:MAG: kelch repeat-containing protein [Chitinophagales bacterium]
MKEVTTFIIFLLLFEFGYTQSGQWTWMKGDTSFYEWLHMDTVGVEDSSFHPSALYMASTWTDEEGRLWLFGGLNYNPLTLHKEYFDFIWKYNPSTNNWSCMKASPYINSFGEYGDIGIPNVDNYPSSRIASGFWKDTSDMIWVFGGVNAYGSWNDMWKYDMGSNTWTWIKGPDTWNVAGHYGNKGVGSPTNNPPPRSESACWVDINNDLWLFGGYWINPSIGWEYYTDLWKYNIATNMWTWMGGSQEVDQPGNYGIKGIPDTANIPRSRTCNCSWTDTAGNFYLFGGTTLFPFQLQFNDVWRYNPNTKEWTWLNGLDTFNIHGSIDEYCHYQNGNFPISRTRASCVKLNDDEIFMFGGFVEWSLASITRDAWKYRISTNEWKVIWGDSLIFPGNFGTQGIYSPTNDPRSRLGASCWKEDQDNIWIYGGGYYPDSHSLADLWKYVIDTSCSIVSMVETINDEISSVSIYPNPANDYFNIKFNSSSPVSARLIITLPSGVKILERALRTSNITIDIAGLAAGIYFIDITSKEKRSVFKLIKQ